MSDNGSDSSGSDSSWTKGGIEGIVIGVLVGIVARFGNRVSSGIDWTFEQLERAVDITFGGVVGAFEPLGQSILAGIRGGFETVNGIILSTTGPFAPVAFLVIYGLLLVGAVQGGRIGVQLLDPR